MTRTVRVRLILIAVPPVAVFHFLNYSAMVSITAGWLNFGLLPFNGLHFTFVGYKSGQVETDKTEGEKKKKKEAGRTKFKQAQIMKSFWWPVPQLETKKRKAFAGSFQGGFERPQPTKCGVLLLHQPSKELPSPKVRLGWRPVSHGLICATPAHHDSQGCCNILSAAPSCPGSWCPLPWRCSDPPSQLKCLRGAVAVYWGVGKEG